MYSRAGHVTTETVYGQTLALQLGDGDQHCALGSDTTRLNVKGNLSLSLWISNLQNVLSSTALLSSCKLKLVAPFREAVHIILDLSLFLLPSTFLSISVLSRESCLSFCAQSRIVSTLIRPEVVQAGLDIWSTCLSFCWSRVSTKLFPSTIFEMNLFFSYQPFSPSGFHTCI